MPDPIDQSDQISNTPPQATTDPQAVSSAPTAPSSPANAPQTGQAQEQAPQPSRAIENPDGDPRQAGTNGQPQTAPVMVSNPAPSDAPYTPSSTAIGHVPAGTTNATQPGVQHAGIMRSIAETLAGGPRYRTTVASDGTIVRTQVPLSRADIAMAIAMSAITGAAAGLSQVGPGATGRAAFAGLQAGEKNAQAKQQADQQQAQQARQDASDQAQALVRRGQTFESNSRALLNAATLQKLGVEAIDSAIEMNRKSGVLDVDPSNLENGGIPMTEVEVHDGMSKGRIDPTSHLGAIAGRQQITNSDGSKTWQPTYLVVRDGSQPIELTQDDWDRYAHAGVPGYSAGMKVPAGTTIRLSMKQSANEIATAHDIAQNRLDDLRTTLQGTPFSNKVPTAIDFTKPGVNRAMQRYSTYISHDSASLSDPFVALQQMGADKRNAQGEMQPNGDAKYVDAIASAFGGFPVLEAAHNAILANRKNAETYSVIDSPDKASAVLSAPKKFSADQVSAAHNFISLTQTLGASKAASEVRARAVAEGKDVEAMYRFGKNPITGDVLNLTNAPPSMLVDASGNVIPQDMVSTYKPTAQQRQTGDTARQVLAIANGLRQAVATNPALAGPLSGRSKQALAKLGLGDAQAQKYLDDLSFLTSASTKMHTGRFSSEILKKMDGLIQPGMNVDQFGGALDSITGVAQRYSDEDKLTTIADFKNQQAQQAQPPPRVVPPGATPGRDPKTNQIIGYRLPNGNVVRF